MTPVPRDLGRRFSRLRDAERHRLGRLAEDSDFWTFRPALHLLARAAYRTWYLDSDASRTGKAVSIVGGVVDLAAAVALYRDSYPLVVREAPGASGHGDDQLRRTPFGHIGYYGRTPHSGVKAAPSEPTR